MNNSRLFHRNLRSNNRHACSHRVSGTSLFFVAVLALLSGCSDTPAPATPAPATPANNGHDIAARVGDRLITLTEVDAAIQFQLYDLRESIYQLRRASLQKLLEETAGTRGSRIAPTLHLTPPERPRITLDGKTRSLRGSAAAAVTLSVFCSYQSAHCVRLQPTLLTLLQEYEDLVNIAYYDFPQHFHKQGPLLAEAVRCAGEQQAMWQYQDHLLARVAHIDRAKVLDIAGQLQMDHAALDNCLTAGRHRGSIEADRSLARRLGVKGVPTSFVNGIYLRGPQPVEMFRDIIDRELISLGLTPNKTLHQALGLSELPIKMIASSVNNDPAASRALLEIGENSADFFGIGDTLMQQVTLYMIDHGAIVIDNRGKLEMIKLWVTDTGDSPSRSGNTSLYATDRSTAAPAGSDAENPPEETADDAPVLPAPTAILPLARRWVDDKLMEQLQLEQQIETGEHVVEGHNLMKLSQQDLDEFYQLLGMEPGDVLMMVNEQWVHSGHNPLWEALRTQDSVTAVVMRRGLPVVYQYDIQADDE
ncbi:hypothetical protein FKG94_21830 [Exilibacterium tricleocarpae]|uniref:Thioredoxin-like fold domain-containing protein n=1 Tax=Exilibacterium tricleocarpae TaxID=2591008 RepID=A0A545SYW6_9GAMM|nr:thioredoxin domain-containing protein [Exilibacterium tricleocarpae]TQV70163.1 hypothetical protein FKG94_21830 [Exilibacterium tricleocarpae]